jgi:predicted amino acid racemase
LIQEEVEKLNLGYDQNVRYMDQTIEKNPGLIEFAAELYRQNEIPVNTYVLDLDAHRDNAKAMKEVADRNGIKLYYMSKQTARNPLVSHAVVNTGFEGLVVVEPQELNSQLRYGAKIGHVGHLENIPEQEIDYVLKVAKPQVITVFNVEKARMISKRAEKLGINQNLMIRPTGPEDTLYPYMEGGVPVEDAVDTIQQIDRLPNVHVTGVTSFPCMLMELRTFEPAFMANIETLRRVIEESGNQGIEIEQMNTPPVCTSKTIPAYASKGSTHLEPGLGVSGMSPFQIYDRGSHPEIPAAVYVSEISHFFGKYAMVYAGGFGYIEMFELALDGRSYVPDVSKMRLKALVGSSPSELMKNSVEAEHYRGLIDYHARLYKDTATRLMNVGDTAVFAFRAQMFVTRAQVAVVSGIRENNPKLLGIFDHANNLIDKHGHLLGEERTIELIKAYT